MNPLLQDADITQVASTTNEDDRSRSSYGKEATSISEKPLVPHHVQIGFFLAGLFNNMSYCIILAGAKEVTFFLLPHLFHTSHKNLLFHM